MNKQELLKGLRATQTPTDKWELAYHEAAHAVFSWMFGDGVEIEYIEMRETCPGRRGWVRMRGFDISEWWDLGILPLSGLSTRKFSELKTTQEIMNSLAGGAAENRVSILKNPYWLDEEMALASSKQLSSQHDVAHALRLAEHLCGSNDIARKEIRRMASWTDEALSHPRLWGVIEALAEKLAAVKYRMGGTRACRIMNKAWGHETALPYLEMGPKWRRRFSMPCFARSPIAGKRAPKRGR
jgi:hypothetical protein